MDQAHPGPTGIQGSRWFTVTLAGETALTRLAA